MVTTVAPDRPAGPSPDRTDAAGRPPTDGGLADVGIVALASGIGRPGKDTGARSLAVIGRPDIARSAGRCPTAAGAVRVECRSLPSGGGMNVLTTASLLAP